MASLPLHYIDLRTFSYATEADDRVETALRTFLPDEYPIDSSENTGYHGDRILVFTTRVENADDMRYVLDRVLTCDAIDSVIRELDERVDENCSLFLQFDKQQAYQGVIKLGDGIRVRAKVEAYPARKETAVENARAVLTQSIDSHR